jgi:Asp-tRNA(Asn)/Glu-tRNA(Gln) amidotransferase A subunit family amidase
MQEKGKDLLDYTLEEAVRAINAGELTAENYLAAFLAEIDAREGEIQAWAWLDSQRAMKEARKIDAARKRGKNLKPMAGIPVGVKDIFAVRGLPTEMGSPAFAGYVPRETATLVKQIQSRGAFILGKTVTTECAFLAPSKTRNPWNPAHTPGGSSAGSAAAVAAGFVPVAIGSQTNGSTIRPAAFCGVVGFKPTQGRLSLDGALTFSHTLDQPGIFTRRVEDARWFFSTLTKRSRAYVPKQGSLNVEELRLAVVKTPAWDKADRDSRNHFLAAAAKIAGLKAEMDEVSLPDIFQHLYDVLRTIMAAEAAFNLETLHLTKGPMLSSLLLDFLKSGQEVSAVVYQQVQALRAGYRYELASLFADYDAILTPATIGEAPRGLATTGDPSFCSPWSLAGVPAITIPTGLGSQGLPLGIQIVAPWHEDENLLDLASQCETLFAFPGLRRT